MNEAEGATMETELRSDVRGQLIGKTWPVLDDGHVQLIDVMGDDQAVVDAARVSFGKGTKRVKDDRDLIRFLVRHHHGTPFEMAEIKVRVRVPMDCWRQWIRHRTANVNEYSTRYSEAIDSAQRTAPDSWRAQSTTNKQGSSLGTISYPDDYAVGPFSSREHYESPGHFLTDREREIQGIVRSAYEERIRFGVAREQARKDLPLSTYTEAYWKCDLRNVFHFLGLRMDSHAQAEIRAYADVIGREIVAPLFPLCWEAFEDYHLGSITLSRLDALALARLTKGARSEAPGVSIVLGEIFSNAREAGECKAKLVRLGFLTEGGVA